MRALSAKPLEYRLDPAGPVVAAVRSAELSLSAGKLVGNIVVTGLANGVLRIAARPAVEPEGSALTVADPTIKVVKGNRLLRTIANSQEGQAAMLDFVRTRLRAASAYAVAKNSLEREVDGVLLRVLPMGAEIFSDIALDEVSGSLSVVIASKSSVRVVPSADI